MKNTDLQQPHSALLTHFEGFYGQHFRCADGETRQLDSATISENYITLKLSAISDCQPTEYQWPCSTALGRWKALTPITRSFSAQVVPEGSLTVDMINVRNQVEQLLPVNAFGEGLETLMNRIVESTGPGKRPNKELIQAATAAEKLAGRAIEMRKLQLEGMKLILDNNKKQGR